jgi:hypothetical protein
MAKIGDTAIPMDSRYLERLVERAKEAGISASDIGYGGKDVLLHRLQRGGSASVAAANAVARALTRRGISTPPPVVAVIDNTDYEWIDLGRKLREGNISQFTLVLTALRAAAEHLMTAGLRQSHEAIDTAVEMVAGPTKKSARVKRRSGENE